MEPIAFLLKAFKIAKAETIGIWTLAYLLQSE